jgi:hypothetical protein
MAKSPTPSPERQALAAAHERYAEAQAAVAEAEAAYLAARGEYGRARADVSDIAERIGKLQSTRTYGLPHLINDYNAKMGEAIAAREAAKVAAMPFSIAEEQAEARVTQASYPLDPLKMNIADAAAVVIRAESAPFARSCLERLREALTIVIAVGPDVLALARERLLAPEITREAEDVIAFLDRAASALPGFEARCQNSFWRSAKQALQDDPTASLPQAPVP